MNEFKEAIKELFEPNEDIIHLSIFWRIVLFPTIFVWWFGIQLFAFSIMGGMFLVPVAIFGMFVSLGSKEWKEDLEESALFLVIPIVAPLLWLGRYFYLGEFNVLFED